MKNGRVQTCVVFIMDNGIFCPPTCQNLCTQGDGRNHLKWPNNILRNISLTAGSDLKKLKKLRSPAPSPA